MITSFTNCFSKIHKNFQVSECGLFFCQELPFVGGSPGRIIEYSCCGKSCLEVKCLFSICHSTPIDPSVKLPYLKLENGQTKLSQRMSNSNGSFWILPRIHFLWTPVLTFVPSSIVLLFICKLSLMQDQFMSKHTAGMVCVNSLSFKNITPCTRRLLTIARSSSCNSLIVATSAIFHLATLSLQQLLLFSL